MPRFTKDQMFDELRAIFLFQADHILVGAGREMAERFIGFSPDVLDYSSASLDKVDLNRFQIATYFETGYDFAFQPGFFNTDLHAVMQDLMVFMMGIPKADDVASGVDRHTFLMSDGFCRIVADTVFARWKLEHDDGAGPEGWHSFTTRELALLADMTEGAVRNALADKSENGLKAIPGSRNPVLVDHPDAWRWLHQRRGFIPTPSRPREDRFLARHLQEIQTSEAFGQFVGRQIRLTLGDNDKAAQTLGWSPSELDAWSAGDLAFDAGRAQSLAEALDLDVPLFVGKAKEVTLRRDLARGTGDAS